MWQKILKGTFSCPWEYNGRDVFIGRIVERGVPNTESICDSSYQNRAFARKWYMILLSIVTFNHRGPVVSENLTFSETSGWSKIFPKNGYIWQVWPCPEWNFHFFKSCGLMHDFALHCHFGPPWTCHEWKISHFFQKFEAVSRFFPKIFIFDRCGPVQSEDFTFSKVMADAQFCSPLSFWTTADLLWVKIWHFYSKIWGWFKIFPEK